MTVNISDELNKNLLELGPDATVVVDGQGTIIFANAQVAQTFGYLPTELVGGTVDRLLPERFHGVHSQHRAQFALQPRPRAMGEGLTLFGRHKDGHEFPVEISLSPVQSNEGPLVVAAVRDATLRRDTEQVLVEANRAKSRLLAAASHDLRQPVQTLTLLNQTALRHAGPNAKLSDILRQQQRALDTISQLLASVLDVSKLDSGALQPAVVDCAIGDVFDRLRSDFEPHADEKGIGLVVEPTAEAGRTDPELLRRMLGNLLANAIRYTARGRVHVTCQGAGGDLTITVRDTGMGIPSHELDKIFEEFYQVDRGSQRPEGLGLGLSIVTRLAKLLGHEIDVESVVGQGTAFTVTLPRVALAAMLARSNGARLAAPARGKILVVDDETSVAQATSLLLELEGFDVRVASGKDEALERVASMAPDLIISDYHLRGLETGADVVAAVRVRLRSDVPAIFVTGDTSKIANAKLSNTILLSKPTKVDELLGAIERHIRRPDAAQSY
ncbi:MAG: PAS domain S-box protein [Lysobacterales bacterium]|nr:MAG: PAS domain S-box protein [Xanthomonadales bacterium]